MLGLATWSVATLERYSPDRNVNVLTRSSTNTRRPQLDPTHFVCEPRKWVWLSRVEACEWREGQRSREKILFLVVGRSLPWDTREQFLFPLGLPQVLPKMFKRTGVWRLGLVRAVAHFLKQPWEGSYGRVALGATAGSDHDFLAVSYICCIHIVLIHTCSRSGFECSYLGKFIYQPNMVKASSLIWRLKWDIQKDYVKEIFTAGKMVSKGKGIYYCKAGPHWRPFQSRTMNIFFFL